MILVTGGAGFIGSHLIEELNRQGHTNIVVVDNFDTSKKFRNLRNLQIADYHHKEDFFKIFEEGRARPIYDRIFHLGACTNTQGQGNHLMWSNFTCSKELLHFAIEHKIPMVYASSAAVYGGEKFSEEPANECPLNFYGYSKLLFDQHVRALCSDYGDSTVVGLRFFNVYGKNESHKGSMASMIFRMVTQKQQNGYVSLFEGTNGYENGEQRRDFVHVDDVVSVLMHFGFSDEPVQGIFNVGTGKSISFNEIAGVLKSEINYIPFPKPLEGRYQNFTEADLTKLRAAGYTKPFRSVREVFSL